MKKIREKMQALSIRAAVKAQNWMRSEEGMEIIQVLLLLALGVGLVALFMGFSDKITSKVSDKIEDFLSKF